MSRGIIEAELFRTERVELETRTTDPPSPAPGERWLRTDLSDTVNDKLAEWRWFDGSVTNSIDVVAAGSTDSGAEEVLRVQTPNGVGAIPAISPPVDAAYPSQRLRHAGADYGLGVISIPDSAIHQWKLDEGSGTTVADSVDNNDGTVNGATWVSGSWTGGFALNGDGTNDDITLTTLDNFGSNLYSDFTILFTVQTTDGGNTLYTAGDFNVQGIAARGGRRNSSGTFDFAVRDDDGNYIETHHDGIADGNKKRVAFVKRGNSKDDLEVWLNATQSGEVGNFGGTIRNDFRNFNTPLRFLSSDGSRYLNGTVDNPIIYDTALSATEIQDDYNKQPWS